MRVIPAKRPLLAVAAGAVAALFALIAGASVVDVGLLGATWLVVLGSLASADYITSRRAWQRSRVRLSRDLPPSFALGARRTVSLSFEIEGSVKWHGQVYDDVDASFHYEGLPASVDLLPGKRVELTYEVTPTRRGEACRPQSCP